MKIYYACKSCGMKFNEKNCEFKECYWTKSTKIVCCPNCKESNLYILVEASGHKRDTKLEQK